MYIYVATLYVLPLESGAVFMNYLMYARNSSPGFMQFTIYRTLPFTILYNYVLKIFVIIWYERF